MVAILLLSVFIVATCGLIYELVAGALASYLLGDSVFQFSTIIGCYLSAMGVGSYCSRYITKNALIVFISNEFILAFIGGFSATFLHFIFPLVTHFSIALYGFVFLTGALVGLEIPLLLRILQDKLSFSELVARVLSFDYIGALVASVLFPLLFVPYFGLIRTALFFGLLNCLAGFIALTLFRTTKEQTDTIQYPKQAVRLLTITGSIVFILLTIGFIYGTKLEEASEHLLYPEPILYSKSTPYQRIVLTREKNYTRLYLNGHLQFDSRDEYRYHEALVHVGLRTVRARKPGAPLSVLVLGGGDGCAVREVLKYDEVQKITLVDLDPEMTVLFSKSDPLTKINQDALLSPKLTIINKDAFIWVREETAQYDFIIVDFPDPTAYGLGKLYSVPFYAQLRKILAPDGQLVVQSTSPFFAPRSFGIISATLQTSGFSVKPYHLFVPSFGEWGFMLAGVEEPESIGVLPTDLKFLTEKTATQLFDFPKDMELRTEPPNRLNTQLLVTTYEQEWSKVGS